MSLTVPYVSSNRLTLRPLSRADSDGMFALWSQPEVCRFSGEARDVSGGLITLPAQSSADSNKIIDFFLDSGAAGTGFRWAMILKSDQHFIGAIGFNSIGPCSELAYHLHPRHWGKGLMTEAGRAALAWLFREEDRSSAEAFIEDQNLPSIRLIERLGFVRTDVIKQGARRYSLARDRAQT